MITVLGYGLHKFTWMNTESYYGLFGSYWKFAILLQGEWLFFCAPALVSRRFVILMIGWFVGLALALTAFYSGLGIMSLGTPHDWIVFNLAALGFGFIRWMSVARLCGLQHWPVLIGVLGAVSVPIMFGSSHVLEIDVNTPWGFMIYFIGSVAIILPSALLIDKSWSRLNR